MFSGKTRIFLLILLALSLFACSAACASPELDDLPPGDIYNTEEISDAENTSDTQEPGSEEASDDESLTSEPTEEDTSEADTTEEDTTEAPTTEAATEPPTTEPPEPVVLTILGNGVSGETKWTLSQLKAMTGGYQENSYSTTNNWPSFGHTSANGVSLPYLLRQAGMTGRPGSFKLIGVDGYHFTVTYDQVFGTRYSYATHSSNGSSGARAVEPVISWSWGDDGRPRAENLRSFFGQRGPMEVNTAAFVKDLSRIEVSTASPGSWAAPEASVADGSTVPFGTELHLQHGSMDSLTIYYTTDGSEPNFNSRVYNRSASYFQPHLITPIFLAEDVTVKAFAAGLGRNPSPVVTFSYTVEEE
jgi:hypothetical protein